MGEGPHTAVAENMTRFLTSRKALGIKWAITTFLYLSIGVCFILWLFSVDWHSLLIYLYGAQKGSSHAAFHHFLVQLPSFLYFNSKFLGGRKSDWSLS